MVKDLCFEIIETCLNNCMFCSSNSNCNKTKIIDFNTIKKTIDYFISTGGIEKLSLSGGEPFLHPDLLKIVAYAKSKEIETIIFTSGVTKNIQVDEIKKKKLLEDLNSKLKLIKDYEPDNMFLKEQVISFYNKLTNSSNYISISKETLLNLKKIGLDKIVFDYQAYEYDTDHLLMGRKEESRVALLQSLITASQVGLETDVHFIPMKPNYKEIGDILEILELGEIKNISILNFLPQGRGKINQKKLQLNNDELEEFFELLNKYKTNYSGNIRIGIPLQEENMHKCNAGLEKLDIKFDGTVLPCPAFKEITMEECKKFNIELPNIYKNLEDIKIPGKGVRKKPLCKEIYKEK